MRLLVQIIEIEIKVSVKTKSAADKTQTKGNRGFATTTKIRRYRKERTNMVPCYDWFRYSRVPFKLHYLVNNLT